MPGPGSRAKAKSRKAKTKNASGSISTSRSQGVDADADEVYVVKIDNAEGWDMIVNILCDYFQLPGALKFPLTFSPFNER